MAKETIEVLIEGGKATAGPPIGPALGPLGINIGQVVSEINKKTASFKGMQVPVKIIVDTETKEYNITIGTPPTSALIKKELGLAKASSKPQEIVANLSIEQIVKIAKMKSDDTLGKDIIAKIKEVAGTANSMGISIEGMRAKDFIKNLDKFKDKIDKAIKSDQQSAKQP